MIVQNVRFTCISPTSPVSLWVVEVLTSCAACSWQMKVTFSLFGLTERSMTDIFLVLHLCDLYRFAHFLPTISTCKSSYNEGLKRINKNTVVFCFCFFLGALWNSFLFLHLCLGLVVFLSMMVGAFLWGGLADKVGRRRCLKVALAINCIFAFLSSFAQDYGFFLFFRLLSGIG